MYKKINPAEIASCVEGTIEGLPIILTMKVHNFGIIKPDLVVQAMKNFTGSRQLDRDTRWSIEDTMLRLDVDLSHFSELTEKAPKGELVKLLQLKNVKLADQCRVNLLITSTGKIEWPLIQSQRNNSPNPLPPQPCIDFPTRPEINLEMSEELGARRERISDALTVDASKLSDVKVIFYPKYNRGNVFSTSISLFNGITIRILIETVRIGDYRIKRKKEASLSPKQPINVKLKVCASTPRKEKSLTVRFNANESHGVVDLGGIPEFHALGASGGSSPASFPQAQAHHRVHRVAECSKAREDIFIVDFIAVRAAAELPTERELYISTHNHLHSVTEFTSDLNMEAVRAQLLMEYPYMQTADLEEQQKFSLLVWGCVREYAVNQILGLPHSMLKDESNLLTKIIPA
ncbi:unnamed protein product [Phytomonas sp. EM1]|nr:unnamed protein product [Phytomonas sp. EM1]|eukprot:CCW62427.1 unnamed protein product [Phytomonas sp. isolate EM1]